ncbi:MAG: GNAT family N-acetyltransferase [Candidatus Promineifilaceae bacterium]|jgi:FemAB-related protein (PEP-CTERM system-associated)
MTRNNIAMRNKIEANVESIAHSYTRTQDSMTRSEIVIRELDQDYSSAWDEFVRNAPGGLPLHLSRWQQVMKKTYGYSTRYLMAQRGNEICGVLPLFAVRSRLTGKRLMTTPGGLCALDEETAIQLLEHAEQVALDLRLKSVVIQDSRQLWPQEWQSESDHVFWLLTLPEEEEALWSQLDSNIRRQVRKARKNRLRAEVDRSGALLPAFYDMFSRFTHQVGTPVFGYEFLANVIEAFPGGYNIALVWHDDVVAAGYFQLEMGDTMYGMWGAALPEFLRLRSAYLSLWEIMSDAINHGFTYLDMGRSPAGSNASKFKGQWGGQSAPVYQLTWRENGQNGAATVTNQVKSDQRFQLFTQVWPKLPYSLTTRLGPRLRWHIPFA